MAKPQLVTSASRALKVLRTINRLNHPTLTDIVHATGYPSPTVFRMLRTLMEQGYIEVTQTKKRYRPTALVKELSVGFQESDQLGKISWPFLVQLTRKTSWPAALVQRVGNRMMVREATHTLTTQTFAHYHPGHTLPLFSCASGLAYYAFTSDHEQNIVRRGCGQFDDDQTPMTNILADNADLFEQIKQQGYAFSARIQYSDTPGKTSALAVPILLNGTAIGCVSLIFFANAMSVNDAISNYVGDMKHVAEEIACAHRINEQKISENME